MQITMLSRLRRAGANNDALLRHMGNFTASQACADTRRAGVSMLLLDSRRDIEEGHLSMMAGTMRHAIAADG